MSAPDGWRPIDHSRKIGPMVAISGGTVSIGFQGRCGVVGVTISKEQARYLRDLLVRADRLQDGAA